MNNTRRRHILDTMIASGLTVSTHWGKKAAADVYETKRTGDLVLNMHQMNYSDCKLEVRPRKQLPPQQGKVCCGAQYA